MATHVSISRPRTARGSGFADVYVNGEYFAMIADHGRGRVNVIRHDGIDLATGLLNFAAARIWCGTKL
jgi:hypothetical protein